MKVTKEIKTIGTLVIVLALISTFYMDDYRQVLSEYPDRQLILLTGWDDKVELIGRSHDASIEFYKWKYQDGKTKAYLGSDLVDTVSWQVYVGSKQVKGAYSDSIDYEYNDNSAKVIMKRYVYYDSRRTNFAGVLNMELEIYPNTNKETITWVPANDSIRYNLLSTHATDDYGQRGKLNGTRVDLEKLQISWNDSADQVSSAYRYLNGKIKIRYKSAYGIQTIDPTIKLGGLIIEYWQEDYGDKKYTPYCSNCNLPIAVTFSKDKVINLPSEMTGKFVKKKESSKGMKDWGIELGSNESYEAPVWVSNVSCENVTAPNETVYENCTDFGGYQQVTKYKIVWTPISFPVSVQKDTKYNINLWGKKHIEFGNDVDAVFSIFGIDTWELAWWNGYEAKYLMYVSDDYNSEIPYPVNLSTLYLNGTTAQVMWTRAPNLSRLWENGSTSYEITNSAEDTQLNMTNESALQASYGNDWDGMTGLEGRWDLNNNLLDSTSNNHDGSVAGATYDSTSKFAGGYSWTGANDEKITVDDLDLASDFTISAWLRSTDQTNWEVWTAKRGSVHNWHCRIGSGTGVPRCLVYDGTYVPEVISATDISDSTWHHVVFVRNATHLVLYVDGAWNKAQADTTTGSIVNNNAFAIGGRNDVTSNAWQGDIDEFAIWSRALTLAEIVALNNSATISTLGTRETEAVNTAPTVTANVTKPDTVYTNTDWLVNMTVTDPDADTLSAYVQFYVNDTLTGSVVNYTVTNNTNTLVATLGQGNYSYGDVLIAETWAGDGTVNTSKVNMTSTVSEIRIIGACTNLNEAGETYQMNQSISDSTTNYCMNISANNVTLDCRGYTIDGNDAADYGLYISRAAAETTNVTIKNCVVTDWDTCGIYLKNADGNNITNITITSNPDKGIYLSSSDENELSEITYSLNDFALSLSASHSNTIKNNYNTNGNIYGFHLDGSDSNDFTNITSISNAYGFHIASSALNTFTNMTLSSNINRDILYYSLTTTDCQATFTDVTGTGSTPIVFYNYTVNLQSWNNNVSEVILCDSDDSIINDMTLDGTDENMLYILLSDNVTISNSYFKDLEQGIHAHYMLNSLLENITFTSNIDGIYLSSSDGNELKNITSYSNTDDGIYLSASDSNIITNSNIYSNSDDGIFIDGNYNTISDTNIYSQSGNTDYGLHIDDDHNIIENVSSYSNYYGMRLDTTAQNNTIYDSSIYSNTYGLYVYGAGSGSPNIIYNNLFNQTNNVLFTGTLYDNTWNTTQQAGTRIYSNGTEIGGNYWTNSTGNDYSDNCTDSNTNGFCDDYYNLTTGNIDWLPLSNKYSVGDTCDCPASGNMVIDCSENCDISSCDLQTNNFTATGDGTVTGFKNLYNYTWGMIRCTNWEIE